MTLRLIQVGLGWWGWNWAFEITRDVPGVELVAWVDRDPVVRAREIERVGLPPERVFATLEEACRTVEADAALLVVPLAAHRALTEAAIEAGLHVLVEKPFTETLADARRLAELARQRGRVLMVSQNYRWFPAPRHARTLLHDGAIGEVTAVTLDFAMLYGPGYRYFFLDEPLLSDMAIHHFDALRFLLKDEPVEVACWGWNEPGSPFKGNPAALAVIRFARGTRVSYRGSWIARGAQTDYGGAWRLEGTEGALQFSFRGPGDLRELADRLTLWRGGRQEPVTMPGLTLKDRKGVLATFADWIARGERPEDASSAEDNIMSLALVFAAIRSARAGGAAVRVQGILEDDR